MISAMFTFGAETILVVIQGNNVTFGNTMYGAQMAPISGLKLDRSGVEREFPDLKDNPAWREEAIKRFKEKISSFKSEGETLNYIVEDLHKFGYKPLYKQIQGHRKEPLK